MRIPSCSRKCEKYAILGVFMFGRLEVNKVFNTAAAVSFFGILSACGGGATAPVGGAGATVGLSQNFQYGTCI